MKVDSVRQVLSQWTRNIFDRGQLEQHQIVVQGNSLPRHELVVYTYDKRGYIEPQQRLPRIDQMV